MRLAYLLILSFYFTNCAYKISRHYFVPKNTTYIETCNPLVVKKKNLSGIEGNFLGSISLDDSGVTLNCSEEKAIKLLKIEACEIGASLINITDEVHPNLFSTCYRCTADFHYVDNIDEYSKILLTNKPRDIMRYDYENKIKWSDFQLKLDELSIVPYEFFSNIELNSDNRSFWTGAFKGFSAQGVFYRDISKLNPSFSESVDIEHIQLLFDLTQIYAKRLEDYIMSNNIRTGNFLEIQALLNKYVKDLYSVQASYIKETNYGYNQIRQFQ